MNGVYIRNMPAPQLAVRIQPVLAQAGYDADLATVTAIVPLIRERIKTLNDVVPMTDFFFSDPQGYDPRLLLGKKMSADTALAALARAGEVLEASDFTEEALDGALRAGAASLGLKAGDFFAPIRAAVTGKAVSPPLFGSLVILGRNRVLKRLEAAIRMLSNSSNS
jgi:glutamyl-tRNA synthetase